VKITATQIIIELDELPAVEVRKSDGTLRTGFAPGTEPEPIDTGFRYFEGTHVRARGIGFEYPAALILDTVKAHLALLVAAETRRTEKLNRAVDKARTAYEARIRAAEPFDNAYIEAQFQRVRAFAADVATRFPAEPTPAPVMVSTPPLVVSGSWPVVNPGEPMNAPQTLSVTVSVSSMELAAAVEWFEDLNVRRAPDPAWTAQRRMLNRYSDASETDMAFGHLPPGLQWCVNTLSKSDGLDKIRALLEQVESVHEVPVPNTRIRADELTDAHIGRWFNRTMDNGEIIHARITDTGRPHGGDTYFRSTWGPHTVDNNTVLELFPVGYTGPDGG